MKVFFADLANLADNAEIEKDGEKEQSQVLHSGKLKYQAAQSRRHCEIAYLIAKIGGDRK